MRHTPALPGVERRHFLRLRESLRVRVGPPMNLDTLAVEVSGGSVLLYIGSHLENQLLIGEEWALKLYLPEHEEPLSVVGKVQQVRRVPPRQGCQVVLVFVQIQESTRKAIIQYIFHRQLQKCRSR